MSLPTRECGLKLYQIKDISLFVSVTPYAGVWIEITRLCSHCIQIAVTPYAGVWIEIS